MKRFSLIIILLFTSFLAFSQWNSNTSINLQIASTNVSDQQAVSTSDGKTWIAFYNQNSSTGNYDMRAQLLDENGYKLLGNNGVLVSDQISGSATFVFNVCTDIFNNLVIAFQYEVSGVLKSVVTKVNTDGSLPWGNGVVLGEGLAPYPAITKTNEVVVAWNNNSPSTTYVQKISSGGTIAWAAPTAVTVGTSNTTRAQVACNDNGDFTLVFQKKSFGISTTLYAQRYTTNGSPIWAAPVQLSNQTTSGARYYSILNEGNTVYFGYYAALGSRFFAFVQKIKPDGSLPWGINGSPVSSYSSGSDPMQQTTNIAHDNNSAYIWSVTTYCNPAQTAYGVYVQKFDTTNGTAQLEPHGKEVYPVSSNYDTQTGALSLVNDGPFFINYDASYKIYATRLNNVGDFVWPGNRVELSSTTSSPGLEKGRFGFTKVVNGQSVAVWSEHRGVEYNPYAQNIPINGVLPVSFSNWTGEKKGTTTLLKWTTCSEINCRDFTIERSIDGRNFETIGKVNSLSGGNTSGISLNYSYVDLSPKQINYYRLKQTDFDGRNNFSPVILIQFEKNQGSIVYPSPAYDFISIGVTSNFNSSGKIQIRDAAGNLIIQKISKLNSGNNVITLPVAGLTSGVYFYNITCKEEFIGKGSFIKK